MTFSSALSLSKSIISNTSYFYNLRVETEIKLEGRQRGVLQNFHLPAVLLKSTRGAPFPKSCGYLPCLGNKHCSVKQLDSDCGMCESISDFFQHKQDIWCLRQSYSVFTILKPKREMTSGLQRHKKDKLGYFVCVYLFLMCFIFIFIFFICPQSHISHYYVRSVFPHCNGSQLHKSPNPAWPPHLTKICHFSKKTFFIIITYKYCL